MTTSAAPATRASRCWALPALAITSVAFLAGTLWWGLHGGYSERLIMVVLLPLGFIPALVAAGWLPRLPALKRDLVWIFSAGILLRVIFALPQPYLSDDVYRYVWDGRVQVAGYYPYGVAPESITLDGVESGMDSERRLRQSVNHPHIPTIYPPLLELVFRANATLDRSLAWLGGGVLMTWRALLLLVEIGIALVLVRMLRHHQRDPRLVLLYLWHPLPIVESLWSAHTESIAVLLLLAAVGYLEGGRVRRGGALLGVAGAAKLLPFGLMVLLLRRHGWRVCALAGVCAGLTMVPFLSSEAARVFEGLNAYARSWYFNDIVFHPVGWLFGVDVNDKTLLATKVLRVSLMAAFALVCVVAGLRIRKASRAALVICGAFVLLTPTLHPWYLLWVLPFAIVCGSRPLLVLSVTVMFSHITVVQGREMNLWGDVPWTAKLVEFTPPLALLLWEVLRRRFSSRREPPETP